MSNLKISVVTAVYNGEKYIEECLKSIMNQSYKNFEHIVMDGGSTDRTVEIVKKYEKLYNVKVYSQKDNGMYDAIVKGFDKATGDILCWLNSDDKYFPWAFEVMQKVITETEAEWCMGFPTFWDTETVNRCQYRISSYSRYAIRKGYHDGRILPFIQQESCFWTKDLWIRANGALIRNYKMAGDFQLWKKFASYTQLYKVNSMIAGFRHHTEQKSSDMEGYYQEVGVLCGWSKLFAKTKLLKVLDALFSLKQKREMVCLQEYYRH